MRVMKRLPTLNKTQKEEVNKQKRHRKLYTSRHPSQSRGKNWNGREIFRLVYRGPQDAGLRTAQYHILTWA
uniref:Uncharacterized protein n=1 Tax=Anguilla anguilla TaxID=7936 RepID=A0A0E9Q5N1_ANGAN